MGKLRFIVDRWGPLNYKRAFADPVYQRPDRDAFPAAMRTWVPEEDRRRLASYTVTAAYGHNQAWEIDALNQGEEARSRREFGDPAMLVASLTSHLLGREQTILVDGAEDAETTDGNSPPPDAAHAADVQDKLRSWAKKELFSLRLQQNERKAVREGDGVYTLAWDAQKKRPRLSVVDPGFYFPDLPDNAGDSADYPTRVHFAWEVEPDPAIRGQKRRLRRITYELAPIGTRTVSAADRDRPTRIPALADDGSTPLMTAGDTWDPASGQILRQYPWNDDPTHLTCYLTDAEWDLDDIKADQDIHTLDERYATYLTRPDGEVLDHLDLWQDYIPVVHLPNTIPEDGHWGESSLALLMQVFDELAGTDRDSALASASTGNPIIGIVNGGDKVSSRRGEPTQRKMKPGMAIELGQGGNLITVDTSPQLAELRNKTAELQDRLSLNARMPAVALGTLDPTKAPSGFAIDLSYGPMDPLIDSMHLARDHKYELLLKMVQRQYLAGQHPDWSGPVVPARLAWGTYKPTDKAATLTMAREAVDGGVMSLETGLQMLVDVGFPIDDISEEIERIQARQFDKARTLADATNDMDLVGNFLGVTIEEPEPPAAPPPNLPQDAQPSPPGVPQAAPGESGGNT